LGASINLVWGWDERRHGGFAGLLFKEMSVTSQRKDERAFVTLFKRRRAKGCAFGAENLSCRVLLAIVSKKS